MASICQKGITLPPFSSIANEALVASNITTRIPKKLPQPGQFKFIMYQAEIPASSSSATTSMQGRNKKVVTEIKTKTRSKISPNTSPKNSKVKKNSRKSPLSSSVASASLLSSSSSSSSSTTTTSSKKLYTCKMQHFLPESLQRTVIPNSYHIPPPKLINATITNNHNINNDTYINPHFKYSRSRIERNNSFYRPTTIAEYVDPLRNYWQYTNYHPETMNANCMHQETTKTLLCSQSSALSEFQRSHNFALSRTNSFSSSSSSPVRSQPRSSSPKPIEFQLFDD